MRINYLYTNMEKRYTQGKWYANGIYIMIEGKTGAQGQAFKQSFKIGEQHDEEAEANAKLMAAAPEMLEALQKIANWELPETGQFWEDDKSRPVSYTAEHGTEGAKRFIQNIAINILNKL